MAFYSGYDTDDLTQRQYHYFCKIQNCSLGNKASAFSFLEYCITRNYDRGQCNNYDGDCDWLLMHPDIAEKSGIKLDEIYS